MLKPVLKALICTVNIFPITSYYVSVLIVHVQYKYLLLAMTMYVHAIAIYSTYRTAAIIYSVHIIAAVHTVHLVMAQCLKYLFFNTAQK